MHPGQQGYGYYGAPMMTPRPTAPRTLGTLSMVFGGLIAATSLLGLVTGGKFGGLTRVEPSQQEAFDAYVREIQGASMTLAAIMMVMSAALFIIGSGQRRYMRWAVKATLVWSLAALAVLVLNGIIQVTVILPELERFIEQISFGGEAGAIGKMMKVSTITGVLFYAPYPIILLVAFRRPDNVRAMDQPPRPDPATNVF